MEKSEQNIGVVSNFKLEKNFVKRESFRELKMPILPKSLSLEEKKFLLAVERGDLATVKRIFQSVKRGQVNVDLNCVDPLGRGALIMAIDSENLLMVELLVVLGISTCDALLHAIDKEFVEAVELLLEHEELIHKEGEPYSWEKVDRTTSSFTPDITPLVLAAHRNNYEILKILLDRGATVPIPHDVRCGCDECIRGVLEDSLRHSMSRINAYRALSSPSLIALSSTDPILTAFDLSSELKKLAYLETEFRQEYLDLRKQCQQFACDLLSHTRSSTELAVLLNQDPGGSPITDDNIHNMNLARLELAIDYKQKKFVAHPNIQQLLASIWYEGLPGFRRKSPVQKLMEIVLIALAFPFYCLLYMVAPSTSSAQLMKKPFMKFLIHASSYLFFLLLLILVSQRFDVLVIEVLGTESMRRNLEIQLRRQRGNGPTALECIVVTFVLGYIFEEIREIWKEGMNRYLANMWNVIDICRDGAYSLVIALRVIAYFQQRREIELDPASAYLPKEKWDDFDPQLISEGVCAMANIFSALKLVHLFSINPYLGPLQISLGRMVIDIIKFFFIYTLVLFAFACGLNQLLWYFSDLERQKCYTLPGGLADWEKNSDACLKWRRFANLFEATQSLFWASFGLVDLSNFELTGVKSYTRFWSMLIFGSYSVINVVVLLNLLIAMMSNSYALITEHSDTEWKFARSKLWMSYFDESSNTLPPPFNLFPRPKSILRLITRAVTCNFSGSSSSNNSSFRRTSTKRGQQARLDRDYRYAAVTRSLVWRYVINMHRLQEMSEVTEDDINEVKGDISTLRFELLEVFKRNGMDISSASKNTQAAQGRKMRIWERRLLRDFHVVSVAVGGGDGDGDEQSIQGSKLDVKKNGIDNFRRLASVAVAINSDLASDSSAPSSTNQSGKPRPLMKSLSQIGKSMSSESFQSSQNLRKAMEEAQRLVVIAPTPDASPSQERKTSNEVSMASPSPLPIPIDSGARVLEFLRMSDDDKHMEQEDSDKFCQNKPWIKERKEEKKKVEDESKTDQSKGSLPQPNQPAASDQVPQVPKRGKTGSVNTSSAPVIEPESQVNSSRLMKKAPPVPTDSASSSSKIPSTSSVDEIPKVDAMSAIAEMTMKKNVISFKQEPSLPNQSGRDARHEPFKENLADFPPIETNTTVGPSHDSNNATMYEVIQEGRPSSSSMATGAAFGSRKGIERGESLNKEGAALINSPDTAVNFDTKETSPIKSNVPYNQLIPTSSVSPIGTIDVQIPEVIKENVPVLSETTSNPPIDPKNSPDSCLKKEESCSAKKSVDDVKTIKRQPSNGWL